VGLVQAQHGNGFQQGAVDKDSGLQQPILPVRRLQLGLVAAARVSSLSQAKASGDAGQRPSSVSYWRVWSPSQKRRLRLQHCDPEGEDDPQNCKELSLPAEVVRHEDSAKKEAEAEEGKRRMGGQTGPCSLHEHDNIWLIPKKQN